MRGEHIRHVFEFGLTTGQTTQREIIGGAFSTFTKAYTYRYNQKNPTSSGTGVEHAAENWMMFLGTNTGYADLPVPLTLHTDASDEILHSASTERRHSRQ